MKIFLDKWCDKELETVKRLDEVFLKELEKSNYVRPEAELKWEKSPLPIHDKEGTDIEQQTEKIATLFGRGKNRCRPPKPKRSVLSENKVSQGQSATSSGKETYHHGFVMTLMKTDVGTGQTTPGKSRRSPEIFIPLKARNAKPEFWGWPDKFTESLERAGKVDRFGVRMRLGGDVINVNMMTWPVKHDFRLRSEKLRSAGEIGDLIRIEKTDSSTGFEYYVEIIPQKTGDYEYYRSLCTNRTTNSERKWGYY